MVRALQNDGARCVQSARSAVLLLQKIGGNEQGELTSLAQRTILLVVVSKSTGEQARWSAAEGFACICAAAMLLAYHIAFRSADEIAPDVWCHHTFQQGGEGRPG